jgi:AsmA-like C-terminal region
VKKNWIIASIILSLSVIFGFFIFSFLNIKNHFVKFVLPEIKKVVKKETGLELNCADVKLSFSKLVQFTPALKITQISLGNTLKTKELVLVINLRSLFDKEIRIKKILIKELDLVLEENEKREIKLRNFEIKKSKKKKPIPFIEQIKKITIEEIFVTNSSINFHPYKSKEPINLTGIELKVKNIKLDESKSLIGSYDFKSKIFGKKSQIKSVGEFGPFDIKQKKYPVQGNEEFVIYLKELPNEIKKQILTPDLIVSESSSIEQQAVINGDLNSAINGSGNININNIQLGKNPEYRLDLKSTLAHSFTFYPSKADLLLNLKSKLFKLKIKNQDFGDLILKANYTTNLHNQFSSFNISGSFTGLEIKDALNCFTRYRNILSGKFAINSFQLSSQGRNPDELFGNLKGKAVVSIQKGSLYILKSLTRYQNLIDQLFTNAENFTQKISGEFIDLKTNITIANKAMHLSDIVINVSSVKIEADGFIKEQGVIEFYANLLIDKIKTSIPLIISGTIDKPSIKPDLSKLTTTKTTDLVQGFLELGLKSLNKKNTKTAETPQTTNPANPASEITNTQGLTKEQKQQQMIQSLMKLGIDAINKSNTTSNGQVSTP